jgi:heptosyltransferase-1
VRLLLIRLSAVGDIVHTWPLAVALREALPEVELEWVVEEAFVPLVAGHPAVTTAIPVNTHRWRRAPFAVSTRREISSLRRRLRHPPAEVCIDAQGVAKAALIAGWSRAPRRVGLARPWRREALAGLFYTETVPGSSRHRHVVATNLELARAIAGSLDETVPNPDGRWLLGEGRGGISGPWGADYAVILPGTGHPTKTIAVDCLAEVARSLAGRGLAPVIAWGPGERERAEAVVSGAGEGAHLAPPTDLTELAQLLAGARVAIGGDTGPVHLAASLGVATVGIHLATSWQRNGPLGPQVRVVSAVDDSLRSPSGSARARPIRRVEADEIVQTISELVVDASKCYNSRGSVSGVDE